MKFQVGVIVLISLAAAFILNPARTAEKTPQYVCCTETELVYSNGNTQRAGCCSLFSARSIYQSASIACNLVGESGAANTSARKYRSRWFFDFMPIFCRNDAATSPAISAHAFQSSGLCIRSRRTDFPMSD